MASNSSSRLLTDSIFWAFSKRFISDSAFLLLFYSSSHALRSASFLSISAFFFSTSLCCCSRIIWVCLWNSSCFLFASSSLYLASKILCFSAWRAYSAFSYSLRYCSYCFILYSSASFSAWILFFSSSSSLFFSASFCFRCSSLYLDSSLSRSFCILISFFSLIIYICLSCSSICSISFCCLSLILSRAWRSFSIMPLSWTPELIPPKTVAIPDPWNLLGDVWFETAPLIMGPPVCRKEPPLPTVFFPDPLEKLLPVGATQVPFASSTINIWRSSLITLIFSFRRYSRWDHRIWI